MSGSRPRSRAKSRILSAMALACPVWEPYSKRNRLSPSSSPSAIAITRLSTQADSTVSKVQRSHGGVCATCACAVSMFTRRERQKSARSLVCFLQALAGRRTRLELRNEIAVTGTIQCVDCNMKSDKNIGAKC